MRILTIKKRENIKRANVRLPLIVCLLLFIAPLQHLLAKGNASVKTIVLDAGHGGADPGAIGPGKHNEKDLALAVTLQLGRYIEKNFPDVTIIYTRLTDKFVTLHDRAEIANKAKADLFMCIHLNSNTNHEAFGTATYVLGLHRSEDNLEVAKRENAVIELESALDKKQYEFNPNSPEGHIMMSMKQNAFLDQSIKIASNIEDQLQNKAKRKSRGVKQAGFYVLYKTAMPSILAEIGFVSNPTEEQYLASEDGQDVIASALFRAFRNYKNSIEGNPQVEDDDKVVKTDQVKVEQPKEETQVVKQEVKKEEPVKEELPIKEEPLTKEQREQIEPLAKKVRDDKLPTVKLDDLKPKAKEKKVEEPKTEEPTVEKPKKEPKPVVVKRVEKPIEKPQADKLVPLTPSTELVFKIQLVADKNKPKNYAKLEAAFGSVETETLPNGIIRFMTGNFPSSNEAKKELPKAKTFFQDAFVVGYKDGVRLNSKQIKELEGK